MDIQWSGAIDFEPLFRPFSTPAGKPPKPGLSPGHSKMLEDQQEITNLLDRANDPFDNPVGIGTNVNILA